MNKMKLGVLIFHILLVLVGWWNYEGKMEILKKMHD